MSHKTDLPPISRKTSSENYFLKNQKLHHMLKYSAQVKVRKRKKLIFKITKVWLSFYLIIVFTDDYFLISYEILKLIFSSWADSPRSTLGRETNYPRSLNFWRYGQWGANRRIIAKIGKKYSRSGVTRSIIRDRLFLIFSDNLDR